MAITGITLVETLVYSTIAIIEIIPIITLIITTNVIRINAIVSIVISIIITNATRIVYIIITITSL